VGNASDPELCNGRECVVIYEPATNGEIQVLLDLANDPRHDVKTTMETGRLAVVVPDYLYERFQTYQSLESSPPVVPKKNGSVT
jgi:hypothetical protein